MIKTKSQYMHEVFVQRADSHYASRISKLKRARDDWAKELVIQMKRHHPVPSRRYVPTGYPPDMHPRVEHIERMVHTADEY